MINQKKIQNVAFNAARHRDFMLSLLAISIISLIVMPLPIGLVDGLIAANIAVAVSLLMLSIYIPDSTVLSTFPAVLLLTTVFRFALNIATTRLILIHADAGDIIHTFGNFVVAGNVAVGAVIFFIITSVQFWIIAIGSKRVAEVIDRFTSNAIPGKQMGIDADLRTGTITMNEAKKRRKFLQTERSLYESMDKAVKLFKGDAIAGIIMIFINMLGGLVFGVLQKGLSVEKALAPYLVLTVGDGLISQIPALLISVTAGIVVTRIHNDGHDNASYIGDEIGRQFFSLPKGLLISGALLCGFALIPDVPKVQIIIIGFGVSIIGVFFHRRAAGHQKKIEVVLENLYGNAGRAVLADSAAKARHGYVSQTLPLQVDLDSQLKNSIDTMQLEHEMIQIRNALYVDLGIQLPGIRMNMKRNLPKNGYRILVHNVPVAEGRLNPGYLFAMTSPEKLFEMGIEPIEDKKILPGYATVWVDGNSEENLAMADIPYMTSLQLLMYHLSVILKSHATDFIGPQETKYLLEKLAETHPALVRDVTKVMPISQIAAVLRRLVEEEISIRHLKNILQYLVEWGVKEKDVVMLTEYIRGGLKRYISYKYSAGQDTLPVYMFDHNVEETIRKSIRQGVNIKYLALAPEMSDKILGSLKKEIGAVNDMEVPPVLLASMDIRRYVKRLVEPEFKQLPVLSYQELTTEIAIQPLGRITM